MGSTYTDSGGIEKIGLGEQAGAWGTTTNNNFDIIDRLINGVGTITLSGTTHTLTTSDGSLSDGMFKVLELGGSPSGTNTITIEPNNADKLYFVKNASGQTVTFTQGSGGNVSISNGFGAIIFADGAGSGAKVTDLTALFTMSQAIDGVNIGATTPGTGAFSALTVDNVVVNGANIGHTDDTDLITVASGVVTVAGELSATTLDIGGTNITATAAELNILDGVTASASELNVLDGVTASTSELNIMNGVTATTSELNTLDGVTASASEINLLDGVSGLVKADFTKLAAITSSAAELNVLDGYTGSVTELNYLDTLHATGVTSSEFDFLDGVTSNIQTQINTIMPSGVLMPYGGSSAPTGFLLCDGSAVSRSTYADLFSAIGTTYGSGNGSTTFNIPDLRGRVIAGQDDMGGSSANRLTNQSGGLNGDTLGATGGSETHTLTTAQLASHTHSFSDSDTVSNVAIPRAFISGSTNNSVNADGSAVRVDSGSINVSISGTTGSAGSGSAHNNVQPTIILNYIIKT